MRLRVSLEPAGKVHVRLPEPHQPVFEVSAVAAGKVDQQVDQQEEDWTAAMTLHRPKGSPPHYCQLPEIITWGEPEPCAAEDTGFCFHPPTIVDYLEPGTRYVCDEPGSGCGRSYVVVERPDRRVGAVVMVGGREWQLETAESRAKKWLRSR